MRHTRTFLAVLGAVLALAPVLPAATTPAHADALPGPFVTLLASRTEQWPAINCQPDSQGGVGLSQVVAPYASGLGISMTGTVNTLATSDAEGCTHNVAGDGTGETLTSSWADLATLASQYGWTFVPHEYDGPAALARLSAYQQWKVTCGQAQALTAQGLGPGTGMIAYPGSQKPQNNPAIQALQANYGQNCFDFARTYNPTGITTQQAAQTPPYWQQTLVLKGGPGVGSTAYTDPASVIARIKALQPGQWLTIQFYLIVTGTSPLGDPITWSCDQLGLPNLSSDVERYCWSDLKQIIDYLGTDAGVTVTSPLTAGTAFGRSVTGMPPPLK